MSDVGSVLMLNSLLVAEMHENLLELVDNLPPSADCREGAYAVAAALNAHARLVAVAAELDYTEVDRLGANVFRQLTEGNADGQAKAPDGSSDT